MSRPCSASTIIAGPMSGYHLLKIQGYSFTKSVGNGKFIASRCFRLADYDWYIQYYPNGQSREDADYVSIILIRFHDGGNSKAITAHLSFSFIDQVDHQKTSYARSSEVKDYLPNCAYGFEKFIKRDDLERSGWLKDDCFTIRCDITVFGQIRSVEAAVVLPSPAPAAGVVVPPPDWPQHFRALLESGQGADVRFLVDGKTFAAHRCVLAARSPVFGAELYGGMKESDTGHPVQVDEMFADVFKNLLYFVYTDSLPPEKTAEGQEEDGDSSSMVQHLLVAADRYGMERLKVICEDKLCRLVDVSSAGTMLLLAEQHRCRRLKEACLEFLSTLKTLNVATTTDGFQNLAKNFPFILFDLIAKLEARR